MPFKEMLDLRTCRQHDDPDVVEWLAWLDEHSAYIKGGTLTHLEALQEVKKQLEYDQYDTRKLLKVFTFEYWADLRNEISIDDNVLCTGLVGFFTDHKDYFDIDIDMNTGSSKRTLKTALLELCSFIDIKYNRGKPLAKRIDDVLAAVRKFLIEKAYEGLDELYEDSDEPPATRTSLCAPSCASCTAEGLPTPEIMYTPEPTSSSESWPNKEKEQTAKLPEHPASEAIKLPENTSKAAPQYNSIGTEPAMMTDAEPGSQPDIQCNPSISPLTPKIPPPTKEPLSGWPEKRRRQDSETDVGVYTKVSRMALAAEQESQNLKDENAKLQEQITELEQKQTATEAMQLKLEKLEAQELEMERLRTELSRSENRCTHAELNVDRLNADLNKERDKRRRGLQKKERELQTKEQKLQAIQRELQTAQQQRDQANENWRADQTTKDAIKEILIVNRFKSENIDKAVQAIREGKRAKLAWADVLRDEDAEAND